MGDSGGDPVAALAARLAALDQHGDTLNGLHGGGVDGEAALRQRLQALDGAVDGGTNTTEELTERLAGLTGRTTGPGGPGSGGAATAGSNGSADLSHLSAADRLLAEETMKLAIDGHHETGEAPQEGDFAELLAGPDAGDPKSQLQGVAPSAATAAADSDEARLLRQSEALLAQAVAAHPAAATPAQTGRGKTKLPEDIDEKLALLLAGEGGDSDDADDGYGVDDILAEAKTAVDLGMVDNAPAAAASAPTANAASGPKKVPKSKGRGARRGGRRRRAAGSDSDSDVSSSSGSDVSTSDSSDLSED